VTCLGVEGKRAVIGFIPSVGPGPLKVVVVDNGSTGSPADEFSVGLDPDCSDESGVPNPASLSSGDIVVRDVPTKAQCQTAPGATTRTRLGSRLRVKATASPSRSALSNAPVGFGPRLR
jgi:hypothetical protein